MSSDHRAALWVSGGSDAPITLRTVAANVAGFDGGRMLVELGPSGLSFSPPATLAVKGESIFSADAGGYLFPIPALRSSTGQLEGARSITLVRDHGAGDSQRITLAEVPHFSAFSDMIEPQASAYLNSLDRSAYVGQPFSFSIAVNLHGMLDSMGTIRLESSPGLRIDSALKVDRPVISFTYQIADALCEVAGEQWLRLFADLNPEPFFGSPVSLKYVQELKVNCLARTPPQQNTSLELRPDFQDLRVAEAAAQMTQDQLSRDGQALADLLDQVPFDGGVAISTLASFECGVDGKHPCELGVTYQGELRLKNPTDTPVFANRVTLFSWLKLGTSGGTDLYLVGANGDTEGDEIPAMGELKLPFAYRCRTARTSPLQAAGYLSQYATGQGSLWAVLVRAEVQCGGEGDAVMLSDKQNLSRSAEVWSVTSTGVSANVIAATPQTETHFGAFDEQSVGVDGVTSFEGVQGFPKLRLQSSLQNAVFSFGTTGYTQTGLVGTPAYGSTDTLTVTGLLADGGTASFDDGGIARVAVPAPPRLPSPGQIFGPRAGLATPIRLPDGTFDVLYVSALGASPRGGQGGVFRTVAAADMALDGGVREALLLDDSSRSALASWGISPTIVYVAAYRQALTAGLFGRPDGGARPVPVQAGRMMQINVSDLAP